LDLPPEQMGSKRYELFVRASILSLGGTFHRLCDSTISSSSVTYVSNS